MTVNAGISRVIDSVKETLAAEIGIDEEEIELADTINNLTPESLQIQQVLFRIGQKFNLSINLFNLLPWEIMSKDSLYVENGMVTPTGLATMDEHYSFLNVREFRRDPRVEKLSDLLTVEALVLYIYSKTKYGS